MAERTLNLDLRGNVFRFAEAIESGQLPPELLFTGAAGTGKSFGILLLLHLLSSRVPNLRILIARKTRESLTESVLVTYEQEVLPLTGDQWLADGCKRRVRQSYQYPNKTEWIVGGLDKPTKILSTSYDIIFINEAIELTEEDWETLQSRIGRPERSHGLNCLIGDTNPGAESHWLKARCDNGRCELWPSFHEDNPGLHDGENWTDAGLSYLARLDRLTGTRKARLRQGIWAAGEGAWFDRFGPEHQSDLAEYDPAFPDHLAVDSGVHTGAVAFQIRPVNGCEKGLAVFWDYYNFNVPAYRVGQEILAAIQGFGITKIARGSTDPAGSAKTATGETAVKEYGRAGLHLYPWPKPSIAAGLATIESFVSITPAEMIIHPRCKHLIQAFANYKRAKRGGQWADFPEDPQHPFEDLMDSLRGGLNDAFPYGRGVDGKHKIYRIKRD